MNPPSEVPARDAGGPAESLLLVLGDQLDRNARALRELDRRSGVVLLVEGKEEAEHVPSHVQRTVLFLSAMRHFAQELIERGYRVRYVRLDDPENSHGIGSELHRAVEELGVRRVVVATPGEFRVERAIRKACRQSGAKLEVVPDESFTCSLAEFDAWAEGRRSLVMEYFYRERRRSLDVLLEEGQPAGGRWNFDADNRQAFREPPQLPRRYAPREDETTREVRALVARFFPAAPGRAESFRWPVTPDQARRTLKDFIANCLPHFGAYEDAMWAGEGVLYHSTLSPSLNLKLIGPRECVDAAVAAYERGEATIQNVEGFVRQIIGWREFIRGVYYREGDRYVERNALDQQGALPPFFWTGETEMNCLRHCVTEVVDHAYGHHIPRLMVIGNFALISGVHPRAVHEWFLGMYVDAVEWVTAPNVIGMSQHADGGVVGTKPYAGSGKYIQRMSNYCAGCRFDPKKRTGADACPFNTFYWDFLLRHRATFRTNQRMGLALKNVERIAPGERKEIRKRGDALRRECGIEESAGNG